MGEPLVIIGNGMAATRLVEELSSAAPGRYAITIVGEEPGLSYNRVLLSPFLAREIGEGDLTLRGESWWKERGITLLSGRPAVSIEHKTQNVWLKGRIKVPFSRLVIATGSEPIRLPLPGTELTGVTTFRTKADVAFMLERVRPGVRVVVIGGGLLGLEAAHGLHNAGASVSVVHLMDRLMERQLDPPAAAMLKRTLEARGITVLLNAESAAVQGRRKVTGLRLKDGRVIPADLIVVAAGIRPNTSLARAAGIAVNRGIVVSDSLETSVRGIHAIGECAEHRGQCYGLVEPAYEQARILARYLAGGREHYSGSLQSTNLKVSGLGVFSAGDFMDQPGSASIVLSDPARGAYRKVVVKDGKLTGAVLFGDTADALWYLELIRSSTPIANMRDDLVFGRSFAEHQPVAA